MSASVFMDDNAFGIQSGRRFPPLLAWRAKGHRTPTAVENVVRRLPCHQVCIARIFSAFPSKLQRLQLPEHVTTESPEALLFHHRVFGGRQRLRDRMPPGIELAYVLAESQRVISI